MFKRILYTPLRIHSVSTLRNSIRALSSSKDTTSITTQSASSILGVYNKPNVVFTHGTGAILFDMEGHEYLDMTAGIAVNALGHGDEQISKILYEQSKKLIHISNLYHNEHASTLAEKLINSTGNNKWINKVFFCNSGTEANEAALKFSRKYHYKQDGSNNQIGFVAFNNGFHGRSFGALSCTFNKKYQLPFEPLVPGVIKMDLNSDVATINKNVNKNIAAVIIEPIQGEGGINIANLEFLKNLRKRCNEVDALLIYDEIQCGLGRTGKLWAYQLYEDDTILPDILTLAKPLGNGFPIGAVLVNQKVSEKIIVGDHGTTFGGNPLACATAIHVLNRINQSSFLNNVNVVGNHLLKELNKFKHPFIEEVRGHGLMIGIQINKSVQASEIIKKAFEKGLLIITCGNNTIRIVPPLILNMDLANQFLQIFEQVLDEI